MAESRGTLVNLSNFLVYPFQFNPEQMNTSKQMDWFKAPNIGGSARRLFFQNFDNKTANFQVQAIAQKNTLGVQTDVSFFEALRSPAPGLLGIANSFFGNQNFPPPKVLFQFGAALIPMPWYVRNVDITLDWFKDGPVIGDIGIAKRARFDISLELDEESDFFKANQIAEKASEIAGSAGARVRDLQQRLNSARSEYVRLN